MRTLARHLDALGFTPDILGWSLISWLSWTRLRIRNPQLRWPYFAENQHIVEEVLGLRVGKQEIADCELPILRKNILKELEFFPQLPPSIAEVLWEIALGVAKVERALVRVVLCKLANDQEERLLSALASKQQHQRAVAAEWLGEMGNSAHIEALTKAARKETQDVPMASMLGAMERLGGSIEEFVTIERLQKSAEKDLKKGIPDGLQPYVAAISGLQWQDGSPVEPLLGQWLLLKAFKFKTPEPSPLLERYCSRLEATRRAGFAEAILKQWIAGDGDIKEKGLLGLVAACGDKRVALLAHAFIKEHYGAAASQSKALVRMLGWIEDPEAIQILLSIGKRFRTRGIQDEANAVVEELAERKGWTVDELADRTIPDGGLDAERRLVLSYGDRTFTATLGSDLAVCLTNEDGKRLKSMPAARKDEEEATVKAAKKQFSELKKEMKATVKLQSERLYEAMCTQRTWRFGDWDRYVNRHPVAGPLVQRLLWQTTEGRNFRSLGDGTLTNARDEEESVEADATIRLAHRCNLSDEAIAAWQRHFNDYEVPVLFDQWTKPIYEITEDTGSRNEITDFRGHVVRYRQLDAKAKSLGYYRAPAEDGGCFYSYIKWFPALKLEADLAFSGQVIGADDQEVALYGIRFIDKQDEEDHEIDFDEDSAANEGVPLGEIPSILLSECFQDISAIASTGRGFDPEWKTIGW